MRERPLGLGRFGPQPLDRPIDRRTSDAEQFGQLGGAVGPESWSSSRCLAWFGFSFGCLPRSRPLALATCMPSRVRSRIRSDSIMWTTLVCQAA